MKSSIPPRKEVGRLAPLVLLVKAAAFKESCAATDDNEEEILRPSEASTDLLRWDFELVRD